MYFINQFQISYFNSIILSAFLWIILFLPILFLPKFQNRGSDPQMYNFSTNLLETCCMHENINTLKSWILQIFFDSLTLQLLLGALHCTGYSISIILLQGVEILTLFDPLVSMLQVQTPSNCINPILHHSNWSYYWFSGADAKIHLSNPTKTEKCNLCCFR